MAEVVNSLFGITPESLQTQRDQALQQEAMQYAKMDPFQRATAGIYTGASRLGGAIGGMLGAQDPAMAQAAQRQSLLQQTRPQDASGWKSLAQQLWQSKDVQGAQEALAKAQALEAASLEADRTRSIIAKNTADQKAAATPADIQKAQRIASIRAALPVYKEAGDATTYKLLEDELNALLPADKTPAFGAEREAVAGELFDNRTFSQLTPSEKAVVNKRVDEEARKKTPQIILPGQPVEPKDWLKFREFTDKTPVMQKTSALLSELPNALETIRMSTSNDIAAAALPKALASVAGEGKVTSNADIQRYARTGGLDERLIQGATNFITGRATQTKKAEAEKYASAIYRGALMERKKFIQSEAKQLGYDRSPNYSQSIADIDAELAKFKKPSDNKPVDSVVRVKPTGNALIDKYLNQ